MTAPAARWPKSVLQVFRRSTGYGKAENNHEAREALTRWRGTVLSRTGGVEGGTLVLGEDVRERWGRFAHCEMVVLTDPDAGSRGMPGAFPAGLEPGHDFLQGLDRPRRYDVFTLLRSPAGFDLSLDADALRSLFHAPRRAGFRVAELREGRPVRVTLNGKQDFSMTGRRARSYLVLDYVFTYLGEAGGVELRPPDKVEQVKTVPLEEARHVDLRTVLY